jgi:hypothetical protein
MQTTTPVPSHVSAVNCNFMYGNCHYILEDNITLDLQEMGFGRVDWVELAQDRDRWRGLGTAVLDLQVQ